METRIKSKVDYVNEMIVVNAKFVEESEKEGNDSIIVHEVNHGFPLETKKKVIIKRIEKVRELFIKEREQGRTQKAVDEKFNNAKEVSNSLNSKEK